MKINPQFITNDQGEPTFAVLAICEYREVVRNLGGDNPPRIGGGSEPIAEPVVEVGRQAGQPAHPPLLGHERPRNGTHSMGRTVDGEIDLKNLFHFREKGARALGRYANRRLLILEGSQASADESESFKKHCSSASERRRELLRLGILVPAAGMLVFTEDFECDSPTQAAQLVCGNPRDGWKAWRDINGRPMEAVLPDDAFARRRRGGR